MPTANAALAHALATTQALLDRYLEDLKPDEYLHRPCAGGNTTAWVLGHLILTERNALKRMEVADLPTLPDDGFEKRFSREPEAPKANEFGDVTLLLPLFNEHRRRLIDAVRAAPAELLDKPLDKPHPLFSTVGEYVNFMALHGAMHAGQITIVRRSLGRPPIV
jgi:uncharacterized damage-inducible protein DinB